MTQGILAMVDDDPLLAAARQMELMSVVASYANFSEDNNPHGERDFGPFDWRGTRCYWKIDYYDRQTDSGSPDPSDPGVTCRLLTILRADEYLSATHRGRSEERPVGKEGVSTCRYRWSP